MVEMNLEAIKEPRGFMKVLQFIFSIMAFATTTGFSTSFSFHVSTKNPCNETGTNKIEQEVTYPFRLDHIFRNETICKDPPVKHSFHFQTDSSSDAQFYVFVGVMAMLYSLAALALYTFYSENYATHKRLPNIDLFVHGCLAVLWLAAASAWADGTSVLKSGCDPTVWKDQVCHSDVIQCTFQDGDTAGTFAKLHISLILGFLNCFLWASNMWFVYKETSLYQGNQLPHGDVTTGNI